MRVFVNNDNPHVHAFPTPAAAAAADAAADQHTQMTKANDHTMPPFLSPLACSTDKSNIARVVLNIERIDVSQRQQQIKAQRLVMARRRPAGVAVT